MKVTLGIFADVDDFDAQGFLKRLASESGRASVVLTMTPGQLDVLPRWEAVSRYAKIWIRFNWGYQGRGTLPLPDAPEAGEFRRALRRLFAFERWLGGVFVGNEPNNPQEWPGGRPLGADHVAEWVASAWWMAPIRLPVGPPPVDLFNPSLGSPYAYLDAMAGGIQRRGARIEFATAQLKTQTSAPPLEQEPYRFSDPPLVGESMNLGATFKALGVFYRHIAPPVLVIPEANPQRKTLSPLFLAEDRHYGWADDPRSVAGWIDASVRVLLIALRAFPIREAYVHAYRWARDEWEIRSRGDIQDAIIRIARQIHRL